MVLFQELDACKPPLFFLFLFYLPVAILICTLMVPSAATGGGFVTACKDRKSAARFRSDEVYSHRTWRLKAQH